MIIRYSMETIYDPVRDQISVETIDPFPVFDPVRGRTFFFLSFFYRSGILTGFIRIYIPDSLIKKLLSSEDDRSPYYVFRKTEFSSLEALL